MIAADEPIRPDWFALAGWSPTSAIVLAEVVHQTRAAHRSGAEGQQLLEAGLGQEPRKQQRSELARRAGDGHPQGRLSAHPGGGV